jgi:DNA-binding CsgD family transcriptional regulator
VTAWEGSKLGIAENALALDPQVGARFIRVLYKSRLIGRHAELLAWLKGEVQQFLPHQILLAAWGDFARWNVTCEVVSHVQSVRPLPLGRCPVDDLLREAYVRWLHGALQGMRWLLVHGVRDKRSGCDSLYIALDSRAFLQARPQSDLVALSHLLLCQMDIVWRRVAASRVEDLRAADVIAAPHALELSAREREVLGRLSCGNTNSDIAEALEISPFTVKNHLKRIFRKIGASNRTQAVARYNDAVMQSAKGAAG